MAKNSQDLQELVSPAVMALGYELLGCVYMAQGRHSILRVYIDSEPGITVDDCQRVSRQVSAVLDVADPIAGEYALEVSSPGLDRPLFVREHYQRFIGCQAQIHLRAPSNKRRHFKGLLQAVTDDAVVVEVDGEALTLELANIEKANLVPEI